MTELSGLKRSREGYRTNAKKIISNVDQTYDSRQTATIDLDQLTIYNNYLQRYCTKPEDLNTKIISLLTPEEVPEDTDKCVELEEALWTCLSKISILQNNSQQVYGATHVPSTSGMQVKLPRLELPKFGGDPVQWQEFWDCFDSTIHKADMSNIHKFKYLKNSMTGDAAKLVDGFRLIDANYETVIDALKERFGNPEVSIFAHFEHLLALPATNKDLTNLQRTYDECEKHIRSLVALGLHEETFGRVFIPIILSKLPRHIRVELHRKNGSQEWNLGNLRSLFKQEITAQQMGEWSLHEKEKSNTQPIRKTQTEPHRQFNTNRKNAPPTSAFVQANKHVVKVSCIFCQGSRFSDQCVKIPDVQSRRKTAQKNGNCFKCLSTKHRIAQCPKRSKCFHCSHAGHHSAFCFKRNTAKPESTMCTSDRTTSVLEDSHTTTPKAGSAFSAVSNGLVYMQMALVSCKTHQGQPFTARIYLDPGSSCTYVTEGFAKHLKLKPFGCATVANARFGDRSRSTKSYKCVHMNIPTKTGASIPMEAFVTSLISVPMEKLPLNANKYPILAQIPLADPATTERKTINIDILIGGDYYYNIVTGETIKLEDGLVLLGSKLGYITAGMVICKEKHIDVRTTSSMLVFSSYERKLRNDDVERFWSLEDIGIKDNPYQLDDDHALNQFNKSIHNVDGRYEVGWPWKDCKPELPTNRDLALKRLRSLICKLKSQQDVLQTYDVTIRNQLAAGTIELVHEPQNNTSYENLVHYLPHHCVLKNDKSPTKMRIVYDASCQAGPKSPSLNDCLLRGPVFLNDLCGLVLKFRAHRIALVSDIEKAFLQVGLRIEDRDVTRFFWLKNPQKFQLGDNLLTYRFTKVSFGIISSPFMLEATIRHHIQHTNSEIAQRIVHHTYVDNVIYGVDSEKEAHEFYTEAKRLFGQIKMNLREWFTNCAELKTTMADADIGSGNTTTVLGLRWNFTQDTMSVKLAGSSNSTIPKTKRQLLQVASSLFDPCGLYAPITVKAKILMQQL